MLSEQANLTIEGIDGIMWHIHGARAAGSPVRLREGDVGELFDAPFSTVYKGVSGMPGKRFRALNYAERNVVLRLNIAGADGRDWARVDSRFRRSLSGEKPFRLICDTEMSGRRWLWVRLAETPQIENTLDPHEQANLMMQIVLTAENPFWQSTPIKDEYVFDGTNWAGSVAITNPGDVPAWPKWVVTAPAKYGLPDIDHTATNSDHAGRMVFLPFQPEGRQALVDTDPFEEMITTTDGTLLWAQMNGRFFQHQLPAHLVESRLPVFIDPFPKPPVEVPDTWRMWVGEKLQELATSLGAESFLALTPSDVATYVSSWVAGEKPDWVEPLPDKDLKKLTAEAIADGITTTYGTINTIVGATAQIIVEPQYTRPWGG